MGRKKTGQMRTCLECGSEFYCAASRMVWGHYCSNRCKGKNSVMATKERTPLTDEQWRRLFWDKVDMLDFEGCWIWTAHRNWLGYGGYSLRGKYGMAHRIAWEYMVGPIPDGLNVCHRCDNPPCVNPAHMFLGTQADNIADRDAKGHTARGDRNGARTKPHRRPRGERIGGAKLTQEDVRSIRGDGRALQEIASAYGVTKQAIWSVRHGKTWRHVL